VARRAERDLSRIGWLDYVLMSIGSCLAVYSAGMSIGLISISYFCIVLVVLGSCVSYGIRQLTIHSPLIKLDAYFYSAGVVASIFLATELRAVMPDGGFPREMGAAGWLCWMLILGSFATWQDSTLLFQAIPALALFGLIGCYDTYRGVTVAFFGFLICLTTLFARAHGREMLRKAAASGYFTRGLAPGTPIPSVETTPGLALTLKKGPWRWIAGPEWALASAIAVVLTSLLGAPVIRESVSSVGGGFVKLNPAAIRMRTPPAPAGTSQSDVAGDTVRIGLPYQKGAIPKKLFEVGTELAGRQYFRSEIYDLYTRHGWQNTLGFTDSSGPAGSPIDTLSESKIKSATEFTFNIHLYRYLKLLPLPSDTLAVKASDGSAELQRDGTWALKDSSANEIDISGRANLASGSQQPAASPRGAEWHNYTDDSYIPASVRRLAESVSAGKKTDFDKAIAIQTEISRRIVYNLDAEEYPETKDPVEYALFEAKQGYCTAFASAMVQMARSIGLPSRYVQGYLTDERRAEPNGKFLVTDADYHAWAELYFNDFGWVRFDPSTDAQCVNGECLGDAGDARPWYQKGIVAIVLDVAILATIIGLIVTVVNYFKGSGRVTNVKSELGRTYISFNRALERAAGHRRLVGQTANEFLEHIRPCLKDCYPIARDLNERFVSALYSANSIDATSVELLRADVKVLKLKLSSTVDKRIAS